MRLGDGGSTIFSFNLPVSLLFRMSFASLWRSPQNGIAIIVRLVTVEQSNLYCSSSYCGVCVHNVHIFRFLCAYVRAFSPPSSSSTSSIRRFCSSSSPPAPFCSSQWQSEWQRDWGDTQCQWDIVIKSYFVVRSHIHILIGAGGGP